MIKYKYKYEIPPVYIGRDVDYHKNDFMTEIIKNINKEAERGWEFVQLTGEPYGNYIIYKKGDEFGKF